MSTLPRLISAGSTTSVSQLLLDGLKYALAREAHLPTEEIRCADLSTKPSEISLHFWSQPVHGGPSTHWQVAIRGPWSVPGIQPNLPTPDPTKS